MQFGLEEAHGQAFEKVCCYIQQKVIQQHEIVKLGEISRYYVSLLEKSDFPNPEYRSEKLK